MANLPVPPGWTPSTKEESLAWLRNTQRQLSMIIDMLPDCPAQAEVFIAQQLVFKAQEAVEKGK